jgi:hypothetical protein
LRHTALLELAGFAAAAIGMGLVYLPAGFIMAGVSIVFLAQGVER